MVNKFKVYEEITYWMQLKRIVDSYMRKVPKVKELCDRCLKTERWGGRVVLMVVDAAFTSTGLNYFTAVVPKVQEFERKFVENGKIRNLKDLAKAEIGVLKEVWKNTRSWNAAKEIALYLSSISSDDRKALRDWAKESKLEEWHNDPLGRIKGVGLITFQYLRMMGGIDTVMPDKIVKRVINEILRKAGMEPVNDDMEFIRLTEEIAIKCGYRPIELCWMTWFVQEEDKITRMEKYAEILDKI